MYCQASDVKEALDITGAQYDARINEYIATASDWIDHHCRYHGVERPFEIPAETTRYFECDACKGRELHTDVPFISISQVTNGDGVVIPTTGYRLRPRNHPRYYSIKLTTDHDWQFNDADSEIEIVGMWGYSELVPPPVWEACRYMAGWMHQRWMTGLNTSATTSDLGTVRQVNNVPEYVKTLLVPFVDMRQVF